MAADPKKQGGSKGQAWFCTTGLPSDIVVDVDDMSFHLHKFPLMSKSRKLHLLITEEETTIPATRLKEAAAAEGEEVEDDGEIEEAEPSRVTLLDFPGGSEAFEMAAKFCYGVKMDLTASNVAPLRCAGEFLEMTDDYCEDNLVSRTEKFFSHSVLKSVKDSIKALQSCEHLTPLAEDLGIVQRCIESIATRASSADPALFGWPVNEGVHDGSRGELASNLGLWNGVDTGGRRKTGGGGKTAHKSNFWFEDLAHLSLPLFKRLLLAMQARDLSPEIVESCLMCYAKKYIPGVSRSSRKPSSSSSSIASENEQKELLEIVITNLPLEKTSRSITSTRFLFGLLRTANILKASEPCKAVLEKKIGSQLDEATLDDLLIPSYSYLNETLYDVDCVERILGYYLDGLEDRNANLIEELQEIDGIGENATRFPSLTRVGKLIDGYLSEIAPDANLKLEKFYHLAIALPEQARVFDDGLYRSVDVYLKAHPWIPESERERICGVIDCQKLTLEACTHAAQNERLPLRAVVQVLFFEQLQLRHAIAGTLMAAETTAGPGRPSLLGPAEHEEENSVVSAGNAEETTTTWRAAVRENQVLRLDMDSMRTRVHQLERECSTMKKVMEKIDKEGVPQGWRGSLTRRFGCKFKTQVCDSQESTVVETRRGRPHRHQS